MKVACLAILDNGNFIRHAARGLRDYCGVDATAFHGSPDQYLHIPDPTVQPLTAFTDTDDYDAFLLNDHTYYAYHAAFRDQPRLVKCNGTWARVHHAWLLWDHVKHGTTYLASPTDATLRTVVPYAVQTLPPLIDHRLLPPPAFPPDTLRVGHAPTNSNKGTTTILRALKPYKDAGTLTVDVITRTPWPDAIQRKAQCHLFVDQAPATPQPNAGRGFGVNAIESLALGAIVLNAPLHPYVTHHFDTLPLHVFPDDLAALIRDYDHDARICRSANMVRWEKPTSRDWAIHHFDLATQTPKLHAWLQEVTP